MPLPAVRVGVRRYHRLHPGARQEWATCQIIDVELVEQIQTQAADLQAMLNAAGFDAGPLDGDLGEQSRTACAAFQRAVGLAPTGRPDATTLQRLRERLGLPR